MLILLSHLEVFHRRFEVEAHRGKPCGRPCLNARVQFRSLPLFDVEAVQSASIWYSNENSEIVMVFTLPSFEIHIYEDRASKERVSRRTYHGISHRR